MHVPHRNVPSDDRQQNERASTHVEVLDIVSFKVLVSALAKDWQEKMNHDSSSFHAMYICEFILRE
jgi:hypothetical protein